MPDVEGPNPVRAGNIRQSPIALQVAGPSLRHQIQGLRLQAIKNREAADRMTAGKPLWKAALYTAEAYDAAVRTLLLWLDAIEADPGTPNPEEAPKP